jgi:hypothetical protein
MLRVVGLKLMALRYRGVGRADTAVFKQPLWLSKKDSELSPELGHPSGCFRLHLKTGFWSMDGIKPCTIIGENTAYTRQPHYLEVS